MRVDARDTPESVPAMDFAAVARSVVAICTCRFGLHFQSSLECNPGADWHAVRNFVSLPHPRARPIMSTTSQLDRPSLPRKRRPETIQPRDGDSAHGNLYEPAADEVALDSDADTQGYDQNEEVVSVLSIVEPAVVGVIGLAPATGEPAIDYSALTIPEVMERAKTSRQMN